MFSQLLPSLPLGSPQGTRNTISVVNAWILDDLGGLVLFKFDVELDASAIFGHQKTI